jgi:hypothetical protein
MRYEYIWLCFNYGDLTAMNRYANDGWKVVYVSPSEDIETFVALMERQLPCEKK